jgi:AcrR family transcriptional regulator
MTTQRGATDRGARRRERTRARLLEAARRVIGEKGFDAATIADITDAADVGFGSFYNHFESKEEILSVLVTHSVEALGSEVDRLVTDLSDPAEMVATGVVETVSMAVSDPFWGWFMARVGLGERPEWGEPLVRRLARDIRLGAETGRFAVNDPTLNTTAISGATLGVVRAALSGYVGDDTGPELAEGCLRLLGLRPADARRVVARVSSRAAA